MSSRKDKDLKDFLVSVRKKTPSSITAGPLFAMQRTQERLWNPKQNRHWTQTDFGKQFRKRKLKEENK